MHDFNLFLVDLNSALFLLLLAADQKDCLVAIALRKGIEDLSLEIDI